MLAANLLTFATVAAFVMTAACLPRGAPPAGHQIVSGRQASLGATVPAIGDGVLRVLFFRPNDTDTAGADLYVVAVGATGDPSPERLLISDIDGDLGCGRKIAPCNFDSQGRIQVSRRDPSGAFSLVTVDPVTGDVTNVDVGPSVNGISSAGHRTFALDPFGTAMSGTVTGTVTDADGRTTAVQLLTSSGAVQFYTFIGEDFYYLDPNHRVIDLPPSDVSTEVAAGVTTSVEINDQTLFLTGSTSDPMQLSIFDTVTRALTVLPFTGAGTALWSSDYRFLLYIVPAFDTTTRKTRYVCNLFDRISGSAQVLDLSTIDYVGVQPRAFWRPARYEIWADTSVDSTTLETSIVTPGSPTLTVSGARFCGFSQSAAYWFSSADACEADVDAPGPAFDVGLADVPTGPRYPFNSPGTHLTRQVDLVDGRVLASAYVKTDQRADVIVVDPRTGDRQQLAERGLVAAIGHTRLMGMFHFDEGRGDLTVVELDSGRQTILAPEFTVTAFAEPQGDDLLAPGARLIYQFQARTVSPYDGIWLTNSP